MKQLTKEIGSVWIRCILLLCVGGIAGILLLTVVFLIPVNLEKKAASLELFSAEGAYPLANELKYNWDRYFTSFYPAVLDDVTDNVMLNNTFSEGENPFILAMDMNNYPRYWHGYIVILRPFFHFMDYAEFRIWNCLAQILLMFFVALAIWNHTGGQKRYILAFLTSYALLMPLALALSLQYSWIFYITFGGVLYAIHKKDVLQKNNHYLYFFFVLGMLTTFFDLLTYPLVAWGFPLIWWLVVSGDSLGEKERVKIIILSAISWIAGYGGFWLLKWIIATPVLGYDVIADSINEIFYRVGEVDEYAKELLHVYERWEVFYANWRHYEYGPYTVILTAWMLWALFHSLKSGWNTSPKSGAYLLIAASSIVWYLVLSNHTSIHHFFTYRIFGVGILAFLCFLLEIIPKNGITQKISWKERVTVLSFWGICAAAGLGLSLFMREDVFAIYGGDYREEPLNEGDVLETVLSPTFSNIKSIGFCISAVSEEGFYRVSVLQDDAELYQMDTPLSSHMETAYHVEKVDWKLTPHKEYQLQITVHGNNDGIRVFITPENLMPLIEYYNLRINQSQINGQPLGSFNYHTRVYSHWRIAYAALMCMMFLGGICSVLCSLPPLKNLHSSLKKRLFHAS